MVENKMQNLPEGVSSLLDTDLYKLTMQCAVLKYFPNVHVTYKFTNRTPHMKLTRTAFLWLEEQIHKLGNISVSSEELEYLKGTCTYLNAPYLRFLSTFRLQPREHVSATFKPVDNDSNAEELGDVHITVTGLWVDTILYEIPLLALVSEAYFKFCDKDWNYDGQEQNAYNKGRKLLANGCEFSEFGTRRRRDYHAQDLVIQGLMRAAEEEMAGAQRGKLSGTSNVHFAMRYKIPPVGTVAHEWFMGIAAATDDYEDANETALRYWVGCFGKGVLGIALTDTFGTPAFLRAFKKTIPKYTLASSGAASSTASTAGTGNSQVTHLAETTPPLQAPIKDGTTDSSELPTYAEVFAGTRQDSGDPAEFVKMMREFYDKQGIRGKKTIVFSDSLNIERCLEYKDVSEKAGFQPTFGVGTFLTNDFSNLSNGKKSVPLNIVIKLSSVEGKPAVKISDNLGKNTGDARMVEQVKHRLGYVEKEWAEGDEAKRWGTGNDKGTSMAPAAC